MALQPACVSGDGKNDLRFRKFLCSSCISILLICAVILFTTAAADAAPRRSRLQTETGTYSGSVRTSRSLRINWNLPTGTVGKTYSGAVYASSGISPYRYAVSGGSLPKGLSLNSTTGAVAGTPTTSGMVYFKLSATDARGKTVTSGSQINVLGSSVTVTVSPTSSSIASAGSAQLSAYVSGTSNTAVTWSASTGTVASDGTYTAPKVSSKTTATVKATSAADPTKNASATVTISAPVAAVSITVSPTSASVQSGGTKQLSASVSNTSSTGVTWSANIGTVSSGGLFTAPKVSSTTTATVKATSVADSTKSAQASITVNPLTTTTPPPSTSPTLASSDGPDNRYCETGNTPNFGAASDTVASLPTACFYTAASATPSNGNVIRVAAGDSLQSAINSASCGDVVTLQAGATFSGTFTLPNKSCDDQHWITIRSSAGDSSLPPEGTRLTPCYAGVSSLPGRPALSCSSTANVTAKIMAGGNQAFITASGANHYRLIGLEITHPSGMPTGQPDTLVALTNSTQLPHHIIVDRCWIHGLPTAFSKRGVKIDGRYLAVIDSTVTDIHAVGTATQGILSGTGTGPLKIVNNFVEGGDSAIGFGGQGNPFGNPSDVEIRRNHMFKPWSWQYGSSTYLGYAFSTKVALESKNSNRVLVEGNIMEHTWGDQAGGPSQGGDGSIAWLGPKNQNSLCPTCDVSDITIRYNLVRHAGGGFYIFDAPADTGATALQASRYSIHDNLLDDVNRSYSRAGSGNGILNRFYGGGSYAPPRDVNIFHNTGLASGAGILTLNTSLALLYSNFSFHNNLETNGQYGITGCAGLLGMTVLSTCAPGYQWGGNVMMGTNSGQVSPSSVGFVNYNGGNGGDYRLCQGPGDPVASCTAASPYRNAGTDGRDTGADMDAVNSAIDGVE